MEVGGRGIGEGAVAVGENQAFDGDAHQRHLGGGRGTVHIRDLADHIDGGRRIFFERRRYGQQPGRVVDGSNADGQHRRVAHTGRVAHLVGDGVRAGEVGIGHVGQGSVGADRGGTVARTGHDRDGRDRHVVVAEHEHGLGGVLGERHRVVLGLDHGRGEGGVLQRGRTGRVDEGGGQDGGSADGGGGQAGLGGDGGVLGERGGALQGTLEERNLGQPRQRPRHPALPTERDVEEGSHHDRVELAAGAAGELLPGLRGGTGLLVGANRGHDIVGTGHGGDPGRQADLLTGEAVGIAVPVEALVVLPDGGGELSQPRQQRSGQLHTPIGMVADDRPLLVCELARGVDDLGRNPQLADVVEHGGPLQLVALGIAVPHLLAEHVGVGADPVAVAAGAGIVGVERRSESKDGFGGVGEVVRLPGLLRPLDEFLQGMGVAGLEGEAEPAGSLVREHQRQLHEHGQRHQLLGEAIGKPQRHGRGRHDEHPPEDYARPSAGRWEHAGQLPGDDDREHDREYRDCDADEESPNGLPLP